MAYNWIEIGNPKFEEQPRLSLTLKLHLALSGSRNWMGMGIKLLDGVCSFRMTTTFIHWKMLRPKWNTISTSFASGFHLNRDKLKGD